MGKLSLSTPSGSASASGLLEYAEIASGMGPTSSSGTYANISGLAVGPFVVTDRLVRVRFQSSDWTGSVAGSVAAIQLVELADTATSLSRGFATGSIADWRQSGAVEYTFQPGAGEKTVLAQIARHAGTGSVGIEAFAGIIATLEVVEL